MKYTYKDLATGKLRYTCGEFSNWTRGGPLNARYAVFRLRRSVLFVPEYCLSPETRAALPSPGEAKTAEGE